MRSEALFSNPQIDARDDGLCPTKLPDDYTESAIYLSDVFIVACQTNSKLLKTKVKGALDASAELEVLCKSISKGIMEQVDEDEKKSALISLDFLSEGCVWIMDVSPQLGTGLQLQVKLSARRDEELGIVWVAHTCLVDTTAKNCLPLSKTQLQRLVPPKVVLELMGLVIRKAILRCEFPDFPEGCKGRPFKEVYKLNAKVSRKKPTISTVITPCTLPP